MKKIIVLLLTFVMLVSVAACGDTETQTSAGKTRNQEPASDTGQTDADTVPVRLASVVTIYGNSGDPTYLRTYERNEYGFYTSIKQHSSDPDSTGTEIAKVNCVYDDDGKLLKYEVVDYKTYLFTYDENGKMTNISIMNDEGKITGNYSYSDRPDSRYEIISYDSNFAKKYSTFAYDSQYRVTYKKYINESGTNIYESHEIRYDAEDRMTYEAYSKKDLEYEITYEYASNGKLAREICKRNQTSLSDWDKLALYSIEEYTYDEKGNILTYYGTEYRDGKAVDVYVSEVYSSSDYDDEGDCLYYYYHDVHTRKDADNIWSYEYYDNGQMKKKEKGNGEMVVYDEDGNIIEMREKQSYSSTKFAEYPVVNDELLQFFFHIKGIDFLS